MVQFLQRNKKYMSQALQPNISTGYVLSVVRKSLMSRQLPYDITSYVLLLHSNGEQAGPAILKFQLIYCAISLVILLDNFLVDGYHRLVNGLS